ncbi:MAG: DnaD domain protein [Clostridia bacterium]|nr:DnaD domain protein [Clostridia bacterium]
MSFCAFADGNAMFGSTPVENMFILEYMPAAPGDFVRVYLYGLMICNHPEMGEDIDSMARVLRVDRDTVLKAFRYWEREGLVMKLSDNPPTFEYISISHQVASGEPMDDVYRYRSFNQDLQMALPGMMLESHEIRIANEWLDILHLPEDVVLMMVRAEVQRRGSKLPSPRTLFKYLNDTALEWAKAGVSSIREAEEFISKSSAAFQSAASVVKQFGLSRTPTKDEVELAEKWTNEWKLTKDDILRACADTVKSANPSFAYLDKILSSKMGDGENEKLRSEVKKLIAHLGIISRPTDAQLKAYQEFLGMGFDFGAIEQAAIWCGENNRHTFEDIARKLEQWKKIGAFTLQDIEEERRVQKQFTDITLSIFERCGIDKKVAKSDISLVKIWTALIELDAILFAAECAMGTDSPMKYINKLVSSWSAKGIKTLENARKEFEAHRQAASAAAPGGKTSAYAERNVTEEEFETGFYVDVMNRRRTGE